MEKKNLNVPGAKDDGEKVMAGLLLDFSRALEEVADVGTFGARKYTRGGWKSVENAEQRYTDAFMRHVLKLQTEVVDPETGFMHWAHVAWNALAVLETYLREEELDLMELVSSRMNDEKVEVTLDRETTEDQEELGDTRPVDPMTLLIESVKTTSPSEQAERFFEFLREVLSLPEPEETTSAFEFNEAESRVIEGLNNCWVAIDCDGEMWSYTHKPTASSAGVWGSLCGDWLSHGYHRSSCKEWCDSLLQIKSRV